MSETGVYYGSWRLIGYTMANSGNFVYTGSVNDKTSITSAATYAWKAQAQATLNDCSSGVWGLDIKANSSTGGSVLYQATITGGETGNCLPLTPNFGALDTDDRTVAAPSGT